jgi:hypothetical protein
MEIKPRTPFDKSLEGITGPVIDGMSGISNSGIFWGMKNNLVFHVCKSKI